MPAADPYPLIVVLGATGTGKSQLALDIADGLRGGAQAEVVNCDSVQVYRGLDVGSAKVPLSERRGIPHHLIDVLEPGEELTAGAYAKLARGILQEIRNRKALPLVVGGTGFYLRALLHGLPPAPGRNQALRARLHELAERRPLALHRFLRRYDAAAATRIHFNDYQKLIRAIELTLVTGKPATETLNLPRTPLTGFQVLKIGLDPPRAALYERLNARCIKMFEAGILQETQALLEGGLDPRAKCLLSLGYKQAVEVIVNRLTVAEAIAECQTRTRQYAKRQMTWFRREPDVQWMAGFGDDPEVRRRAFHSLARIKAC